MKGNMDGNRLIWVALIASWVLTIAVIVFAITPKAAGVVVEEQATKVRCYAKNEIGSGIVKEVEFDCALLEKK